MGRDKGTNVYSNNFEPQVMGLLDARTRVDTKADLTKTATWTSADGNTYVPVGIRVSVTDDSTNGNNGVYMLMGEEYTIASNWMQINGSSGGSSEKPVYVVDSSKLSFMSIQTGNFITQEQYDELVTITFSILNKVVIVYETYNNSNYSFISSILNFRAAEDGSTHLTLYNKDGKLCDYSINTSNTDSPVGKSTWTVSLADESNTYNIPSDVLNFTNIKNRQNKSCTSEEYYVVMELMNNILLNIPIRYNYVNEVEGIGINSFVNMSITMDGENSFISFSLLNDKTLEVYRLRMVGNSSVVSDYIWEIASTEGMVETITFPSSFNIVYQDAAGMDLDVANAIRNAATKYVNSKDKVTMVSIYGKKYVVTDGYVNSNGYTGINISQDVNTWHLYSYHDTLNEIVDWFLIFSELQTTLVSGKNIKTINNQSILGSGNIDISGGSSSGGEIEIIELSSYSITDLPYENEYQDGNNIDFANKIRDISLNTLNHYKLKISVNSYYDVINPYRTSNYAGFYIVTNDGLIHFYTDSGEGIGDYSIQSEGSYEYSKQDTLVSGTNIKTINGNSILGSGNLQIAGGSGASEVLKVSLYDLGFTNGTYIISKGDYSYDSIVELDNNRSSGKVIYAYEYYGFMGMFTISIDDYNSIFYVDFLDKKLKVEYQINRDDTITCTVSDITKYDLSLDVRILNNKIQYRIHEVVPNGYICFYRKKRCRNSRKDRPHVNKYTIPDFYFSSKIGTLGFPAINKKYMIPASNAQLNTWTDFPMEVLNVFSKNNTDRVGFTGAVHASPCEKDSATNNFDKWLTVLNMGLAYNVVNPNFINGIKENNAYPTDIIQSGDMVKFKCRLMVPYELRYTMY